MSPNIFKIDLSDTVRSIIAKPKIGLTSNWLFIKDLYRGVYRQYVLFWEDNIPSLYEYVSHNSSHSLHRAENHSTKSRLPSSVNVFIAGPQIYQRIFKVDISSEEVADWIVANRHRIWPKGIDDEVLDLGYDFLEVSAEKYLYISLIKKDTIFAIENYCQDHGLVASSVLPRAALLFIDESSNNNQLLKIAGLVRGKVVDKINGESEFYRIYPQPNSSIEDDNLEILFDESVKDQKKYLDISALKSIGTNRSQFKGLNFSSSNLLRLNTFVIRKIFRACLYGILAVLLVFVIANIYLSVNESKYSEALEGLEILQQSEKNIGSKIRALEDGLAVYSNLLSKHSNYGELMANLAEALPDSLWYRYITIDNNFNDGFSISVRGYTVNKSKTAELVSALENLPGVVSTEITSLNHVDEKIPENIPSRFWNRLYRFSIQLGVRN